jgi:hypothetical protein
VNETAKQGVASVSTQLTEALQTLPTTTVADLQKMSAARISVPLQGGSDPKKIYDLNFQTAQTSAKDGNEKGALEALSKMRYSQEGANVSSDSHAQNERVVYASLYESTLKSGKNEIEGHIGGGWHKVTRAMDPFIEKNFDRKTLFSKLDEYGSKAGIPSDQVDEGKKGIDSSLYDYYQSQGLTYGTKVKISGDVGEYVEKFVSKMKEVGPAAGLSGEKIEEDAKKIYQNLYDYYETRAMAYGARAIRGEDVGSDVAKLVSNMEILGHRIGLSKEEFGHDIKNILQRNRTIQGDHKVLFRTSDLKLEKEEKDIIEKETSQFFLDGENLNIPNNPDFFKPDTYQNLDYARLEGGFLMIKHDVLESDYRPIRVVVGKEGGFISIDDSSVHAIGGNIYYYFPPSDKERVVLINHDEIQTPTKSHVGSYEPEGPQNYDYTKIFETSSLIPDEMQLIMNKTPDGEF